jgi:hypothetical protein
MRSFHISTLVLALFLCSNSWAFDSACQPLVTASEAKIAQAAWHASHPGGEAMRIADKSYMKMDGQWMESPLDLNEVERRVVSSMLNDELKVTDCKEAEGETVNDKAMRVFIYTTELPASGLPAATAKLYIGKEDGLPYLQTDLDAKESSTVTYYYENLKAPL